MAFYNSHATSSFSVLNLGFKRPKRRLAARLGMGALALGLAFGSALPSLAADPFRANSTTHNIGPLTEEAFEAIFKEGDYKKANEFLTQAETQEAGEPLVHAMLASMAYLKKDLPSVLSYAQATQTAADALKTSDPLRGHLYKAVGIFLQGAHVLKTQGVARGTPEALGMLQTVFSELDAAEAIDANDPELNLLKGYMDLMLAVNLPFSDPAEAITRMDSYGSPIYLAQRGIAIGYRDLQEYDKAIAAVDQAISTAPNNPELFYLKAQLLAKQGAQEDSAALFQKTLEYADQLPTALVQQITWESCVVEGDAGDECVARRDSATGAF
jgi:tetratricopeptide (TPR) repeat protein